MSIVEDRGDSLQQRCCCIVILLDEILCWQCRGMGASFQPCADNNIKAADTEAPLGVGQPLQIARELLISISEPSPDIVLNSKLEQEEAEEFRSKLISISYAQPVDPKVLPVSPP